MYQLAESLAALVFECTELSSMDHGQVACRALGASDSQSRRWHKHGTFANGGVMSEVHLGENEVRTSGQVTVEINRIPDKMTN